MNFFATNLVATLKIINKIINSVAHSDLWEGTCANAFVWNTYFAGSVF